MRRKHEIYSQFALGFVLGIAIFLMFGSHREGKYPKVGGHFYMALPGNRCFHVHHWIICSVLLLFTIGFVTLFQCKYNTFVMVLIGFLAAGTLDGLLYNDRFELMEKCKIGHHLDDDQKDRKK